MEKIYMENNNKNKQSNFMKMMSSKVSDSLSIMMILVAFASFLVIGFNQESYSLVESGRLGDTIETDGATFKSLYGDQSGNLYATDEVTPLLQVPNMTSTSGDPLFCLEKNGDIPNTNIEYSNKTVITDPGLVYILSQSDRTDINGYYKTWVVQTALWMYQDKYKNANYGIHNNTQLLTALDADTKLMAVLNQELETFNTGTYSNYIKPLVDTAGAITSLEPGLEVKAASDKVILTEDGKYYQTDHITVNSTNKYASLNNYSVVLDKAPAGTLIYDNNGNKVEKDTIIPTTTKYLYLLIPADKVTEDNKKVSLSANGNFNTIVGYSYESNGFQKLGVAAKETKTISKGLDLTVNTTVDVDDTRMSVTQSVYFIGLVILLCGIGIIYANTKPSKSE